MTRFGGVLVGIIVVVLGVWLTLALGTAAATATTGALVAANTLATTCMTGALVVIGVVAGAALGYIGHAIRLTMSTPQARRRLLPRWPTRKTLPTRQSPAISGATRLGQLPEEVTDVADLAELPIGEEWGW